MNQKDTHHPRSALTEALNLPISNYAIKLYHSHLARSGQGKILQETPSNETKRGR